MGFKKYTLLILIMICGVFCTGLISYAMGIPVSLIYIPVIEDDEEPPEEPITEATTEVTETEEPSTSSTTEATTEKIPVGDGETVEVICDHSRRTVTFTKLPTCYEEGVIKTYCRDCGEAIEEKTIILPKKEHQNQFYFRIIPTCSKYGYECYRCELCGNIEITKLDMDKDNHTHITTYTKEPACGSDGETYEYCEDCNERLSEIVVLPATGKHSYLVVDNIAPTETKDGYILRRCRICGDIKEEIIPKTGTDAPTTTETPKTEEKTTETTTTEEITTEEDTTENTTEDKTTENTSSEEQTSENTEEQLTEITEDISSTESTTEDNTQMTENTSSSSDKSTENGKSTENTSFENISSSTEKETTTHIYIPVEKTTEVATTTEKTEATTEIATTQAVKKEETKKYNITVKNIKVKNIKKKSIKITFLKPNTLLKYHIQISNNRKFKKATSFYINKNNYKVKKLKKGKTYYIRIRSFYLEGKNKHFGKWSSIKYIKIKK